MNGVLTLAYFIVCLGIVIFVPPLVVPHSELYGLVTVFDTARAVILVTALASVAGFYAYRQGVEGPFLLKLFTAALLIRMILGTAIFVFKGQDFFGGDALTYDFFGYAQTRAWLGNKQFQVIADQFIRGGAGPGMVYF